MILDPEIFIEARVERAAEGYRVAREQRGRPAARARYRHRLVIDRSGGGVRDGVAASLAAARRSHGVRSGAVLALATLVLNAAGYLFNVACIRYLGPPGYGDVAALMSLAALVALPLASVQSLFAREVAHLWAREARAEVRRILRRTLALSVPVTAVLLATGLASAGTIDEALKIGSRATVIAGLSMLVFPIAVAILYGFLQGVERFSALGVTYGISGLARPVLVVPALLLGLGAAGALAVNTVAALVAALLASYALRDVLRGATAPIVSLFDRREVTVLLGGSLAFASLTNTDILLANYFLTDDEAGIYAAAALVGKFVLFLPAAVVMVLLPKATARAARGAPSHRILLASAGVTAALTLTAAACLAIVPSELLAWAFGPDFRESTALLPWFGLAMAAAALVNVYLSVYFAERRAAFPMLVAAAAVGQVVGVAAWHSDPRSIVVVTLGCFAAVLVIHEVAFPHRLARVWRPARRGEAVAVPAPDATSSPFGPP